MKRIFLVLAFFLSGHAYGLNLEPSKGVLGVPWESSEEKTVDALGNPNGYFQATKHKKLVFYGKSIVLIFKRGKLKGFRYYGNSCRMFWQTAVSLNQNYSNAPLRLNGVNLQGRTFAELDQELPYNLGNPDHQSDVSTNEVSIKFGFSSRGYPGQEAEFNFSSIEINYEL